MHDDNDGSGLPVQGEVYVPESNLAISVIARKRVRAAVQVLNNAMKAKDASWPARISAAKALIGFAQLKSEDVRDLSDEEIRVLGRKIVKERAESAAEAKKLNAAVEIEAEKLQ